MAIKSRYIKTIIWEESWFADLPFRAKLLYLYIFTNPGTNNCGVYIKRKKAMEFDLGMGDISDELSLLISKEEIIISGDWIAIMRYPDHQKWQANGSIAKAIISELETVPNEVIELLKKSNYRYPPIMSEQAFKEEKERVTKQNARKKPNSNEQKKTTTKIKGAGVDDEEIPF